MKYKCHYHRSSNNHLNDKKFKNDYDEIISVIKSISDQEMIDGFYKDKAKRKSTVSLSKTLNKIIHRKLVPLKWQPEAALFKNKDYLIDPESNRQYKSWRLDFAKNLISVEVGFNHGEAIAHNMMKTVFACEQNHLEKDKKTELGIIITATHDFKKVGGFDGAVGTYEKHIRYFSAYHNYMPTPIVLIGLEPPESFIINKKIQEVVRIK